MGLFFRCLRLKKDFLNYCDITELKYPEEMMQMFYIFIGDKLYLELLTDEEKEKKEPIKMIELAQRMRDKYGAAARAEERKVLKKEMAKEMAKKIEEKDIEFARSLYEDNMPVSKIASIMKVTEEKINNWLNIVAL